MNKKLLILVLLAVSLVGFGVRVSAQDASNRESTSVSNARLLEKIAELQAQIRLLNQKNEELTKKLELARQLRVGAKGDDVLTLQKILATDRAIYPEGLATGFFGEKTKEAIKRLQEKFGLPATGEIDEKTKELINKILTSQGATKEIPPGLLIAPGLKDRVRVKLENKEGKFEYRIETKEDDSDDSDDDDSTLEVEIENKSNDRSKVKIDWRHDGKRFKRVMFLNTQNETEIIEKVANLLNISKDEVRAAISSDDDSDDGEDADDDHGGDRDNDDDGDDDSDDDED
ncbi:MAG TPA: peptidoglycan-binding protein [Candidatus Nanoarchaeia archaeon]|nr:peptidoglycan-binding protein [Candidatus Nanoarchaeia archaeon]